MDAVTSFELEAQRRREILAGDRWAAAWTRAESTVEPVETEASERSPGLALPGRRTEHPQASVESQPAPATR
jgi:hypothetical protein